MDRLIIVIVPSVTVLVCCLGISAPALPSPPLSKPLLTSQPALGNQTPRPGAGDGRFVGNYPRRSQLDLRAPAAIDFAASMGPTDAPRGNGTFPSERFRGARGGNMDSADQSHLTPLRGTGQGRVAGTPQALAEHFHRQGLPIARLWENHAALVSLGLSPKGKPGIWLVQKID